MNSQPEENEEKADAIYSGGAEDAIIGRLLILSITHSASIPHVRSALRVRDGAHTSAASLLASHATCLKDGWSTTRYNGPTATKAV